MHESEAEENGRPPDESTTPEQILTVPDTAAGLRIDQFLAQQFSSHSRASIQRCIRAKRVLRNDNPCRPADTIHPGDRVRIAWPAERRFTLTAESMPLDIIYEDDDILVLNKPAGLVVHPAKGHWSGTLVHGLLGYDEHSFRQLGDEIRPGIVHRLDRDTSGALVVARTEAARFALGRAFRERHVEKTYLAIAVGEFGRRDGVIRAPIGRHPRDRKSMAVVERGGKPAVTHYRVLATVGVLTLAEVRIETGRTHQIRVHFAHSFHPILGDPMYGGRQRGAPITVERQMLHAWKLAFPHPRTGQIRQYIAPLPEDFRSALARAGLPGPGCSPPEDHPPKPLPQDGD
ncbi:MAG: RluA family pseudouridine synthase [Kiritimatiellaeota bacterium]|nr:RluA family pseudouridine synthase [Kiritimatiellota bacterium]